MDIDAATQELPLCRFGVAHPQRCSAIMQHVLEPLELVGGKVHGGGHRLRLLRLLGHGAPQRDDDVVPRRRRTWASPLLARLSKPRRNSLGCCVALRGDTTLLTRIAARNTRPAASMAKPSSASPADRLDRRPAGTARWRPAGTS